MSIKEHPPHHTETAGNEQNLYALHVPVLLEATLAALNPKKGESYLDLTAGYGGHAGRILERTENFVDATLVDRDAYAIAHLQHLKEKGVVLVHDSFASAVQSLVSQGRRYDVILIDLGVSSPQLDQGERGFSFTNNGPLDMRMDRSQEVTAELVVNNYSEDELIRIITAYGEESLATAKRIARAIVDARPLRTTAQLAQIIEQTIGRRKRSHHPATRTFQALRIAVNQELRQIEETLPLLPKLLTPGGRVGIISFHSLEDRLVKRYFKEQQQAGFEAELQIITKKPLDGATYDVHNPRSRSAKLRVAVKI